MAQLEFEIIEKYFKSSGLCFERTGLDLGIGDDCALLSLDPAQQLAVSMDILQEGVHFPESSIPGLIAQRALAVNLSDLAAMGAEPLGFTLGLSLPSADPVWLDAFSRGLMESALKFQCPLIGGDLIRGNLHITIQVHGQVPRGQALLRSGAKPGDLVYVTGNLGNAAAALALFDVHAKTDTPEVTATLFQKKRLSAQNRDYFIKAFYQPEPRIAVGVAIRGIVSAAIDLSDGLLGDLGHITEDSNVGAEIDIPQLPLSRAMKECVAPDQQVRLALTGGDDYELCLTVDPQRCEELEAAVSALEVPLTRIGEIVSTHGIICLDAQGEPVDPGGHSYSHFEADSV